MFIPLIVGIVVVFVHQHKRYDWEIEMVLDFQIEVARLKTRKSQYVHKRNDFSDVTIKHSVITVTMEPSFQL